MKKLLLGAGMALMFLNIGIASAGDQITAAQIAEANTKAPQGASSFVRIRGVLTGFTTRTRAAGAARTLLDSWILRVSRSGKALVTYSTQLGKDQFGRPGGCAIVIKVDGRTLRGPQWDQSSKPGFWQTASFHFMPTTLRAGVHSIQVFGQSGSGGSKCLYNNSILKVTVN